MWWCVIGAVVPILLVLCLHAAGLVAVEYRRLPRQPGDPDDLVRGSIQVRIGRARPPEGP